VEKVLKGGETSHHPSVSTQVRSKRYHHHSYQRKVKNKKKKPRRKIFRSKRDFFS
jgi:hypothetical protein